MNKLTISALIVLGLSVVAYAGTYRNSSILISGTQIDNGSIASVKLGRAVTSGKLATSGSATGKILCAKDDGGIGACQDIVDTGKTCTCL